MRKVTRGFSEPLFSITSAENNAPLAVVGAPSREVALVRAEMIRHVVPLPRAEQLRAKFLRAGPIRSAYFASNYFTWLEAMLEEARQNDEGVCPLCGSGVKDG